MNDKKLGSIRSILRNELWTPASGLYQKLEESLSKLSADALFNLDMLVAEKEREAHLRGYLSRFDPARGEVQEAPETVNQLCSSDGTVLAEEDENGR